LTVKFYPHTDEILGIYNHEHSHEIGKANTRFTRLRKDTRSEIERLLRLGVEPRKVLAQIQGNIYTEENLSKLKDEGARRSEFCTRADVRRIEKMIEQETVRLASQDGPSVLKWVETLRERARDRWGHGMPAAWMILSNGTEDTINFFLKSIHSQNPSIVPEYFMSDKDHAQMNAIKRVYPESAILLCWWHVLHAWQQHFSITIYSDLWGVLKKWICVQKDDEFWEYWEKIKSLAPDSLVEYFEKNWLGDTVKLWSNVYRHDRNIFQTCDTNMLLFLISLHDIETRNSDLKEATWRPRRVCGLRNLLRRFKRNPYILRMKQMFILSNQVQLKALNIVSISTPTTATACHFLQFAFASIFARFKFTFRSLVPLFPPHTWPYILKKLNPFNP
ncbi:hypothetical protein GALMADRAFT_1342736, partial [Galerina marginata CBS 339.88]